MLQLFQSLLGYFEGIEQRDFETLSARGILRFKRAFNQGIGQFYLALASLVGAAVCLDQWFVLDQAYRRSIETSLGELLEVKRPAVATTQRAGLEAAVLTLGTQHKSICEPTNSPDCKAIKRAHLVFRLLAQHALKVEREARHAQPIGQAPQHSTPVPGCKSPSSVLQSNDIPDTAIELSCIVAQNLLQPNLSPFSACARFYTDLGDQVMVLPFVDTPPGCQVVDSKSLSSTLIPEGTCAAAVELAQGDLRTAAISYQPPVLRGIAISELLEPAIAEALGIIHSAPTSTAMDAAPPTPTFPPGASPLVDTHSPKSRFIQAYFISRHSVLRIWSRDQPDPIAKLSHHERWANGSYFVALHDGQARTEYFMPAYVDRNHNGLVSTQCSAIREPTNGIDTASGNREASEWRGLIGAFCTDFTLPEDEFLKRLVSRPYFNAVYVRIPDSGRPMEEDIKVNALDGTGKIVISIDSADLSHPSDPFARKVQRALFERSLVLTDLHERLFENITQLVNLPKVFFIPLSRWADGTLSLAALQVVRPDRGYAAWFGILGLIFSCSALALGLTGLFLSRRIASFNRRLDLLRNLQVGVILVNERGEIELGNDRAEEILGMKLPKTYTHVSKLTYAEIIDPTIIIPSIPPDSTNIGSRARFDYVMKQRRQGTHSTYLARLRADRPRLPSEGWIRVSASPLILAGKLRMDGGPPTFGVLDPVTDHMLAERLTAMVSEKSND